MKDLTSSQLGFMRELMYAYAGDEQHTHTTDWYLDRIIQVYNTGEWR